MRVTHTPILRDRISSDKPGSITENPRAGIKESTRQISNVLTGTEADLRKVKGSHGSPDYSSYDKSPMMINGRLERFRSSAVLISEWGEAETDTVSMKEKGERGPRRRSRRFEELCNVFEPRCDGQKSNLKSDVTGGEGEVGLAFKTRNSEERGSENQKNICEKSQLFEILDKQLAKTGSG